MGSLSTLGNNGWALSTNLKWEIGWRIYPHDSRLEEEGIFQQFLKGRFLPLTMIAPSVPSQEWEKCLQDVFPCDLIKEQKAR